MNTINQQVAKLLSDHLVFWDLARTNYAALERVRTRRLIVNGYEVILQFNPERIRSSGAKIDKESLAARPCFLCEKNRPGNQQWIDFGEAYQIVINPYPIFNEHLTIPVRPHQKQQIKGRYGDMLLLAEALSDFIVFYNGPKCGASAPDHLHFQAGNKGLLPVEQNWLQAEKEEVQTYKSATIYALKHFLQPMFVIVAEKKADAVFLFEHLYGLLEILPGEYEPMMNLLTWYEAGKWITCLYPRKKLHPACYHAEGDEKILISPATVEMAGIFIAPLERDYLKVTAEDLKGILSEVCISEDEMNELIRKSKTYSL